MDALTRINVFFPTSCISVFWVLANLATNSSGYCAPGEKNLLIAILIITSLVCLGSSFTDTYVATDGQVFWVLILPCYGPVCFSLPTNLDKDRVYDFYFLRNRDYVHGFLTVAAFLNIILFLNPVASCLFPPKLVVINGVSYNPLPGTTYLASSIVRTVPILVAGILATLMVCLGQPRQIVGFQNKPETCPHSEKQHIDPTYAENDQPPPRDHDHDQGSFSGGSEGGGGSEMEEGRRDYPPTAQSYDRGQQGGPRVSSQTNRYKSPSGYGGDPYPGQGPRDSYTDRGYDDRGPDR